MGITGPSLRDAIAKKLGAAASGSLLRTITARTADMAERLAFMQFGRGTDPYGQAWARAKQGGGHTLVKTGALANSFVTKAISGGKGFVLSNLERYAFPLHYGWGTEDHLRRIVAAGRRAASLFATDEKRGKRALGRVDRRTKKFEALTSRAPARRILPVGDDAGEWEAPLAKEIQSTVAEALK
jgi:phage gpG-like protein